MSMSLAPGPRPRRKILSAVGLALALLASLLSFALGSPADATEGGGERCYEQYTEHEYKKQTRIVSVGKITGNISYGSWSWWSPASYKWSETDVEVLEGPAYHSNASNTVTHYRHREYRYKNTGETRDRSREVPCPEPDDFQVIPEKNWDFPAWADVPTDGSATIEISSSEGSKSWTFDTSGVIIASSDGDLGPLKLPDGTSYAVSEPSFTNPDGWECAESSIAVFVVKNGEVVKEPVWNTCDPVRPDPERDVDVREQVDCVTGVVITTTTTTVTEYVWDAENRRWVLGEPQVEVEVTTTPWEGEDCSPTTTVATVPDDTTTTTTQPTTTDDSDVAGIGVEADEVVAPATLPRTGGEAGTFLLTALPLVGLGAMFRVASRRLS